MLSDYIQQSFHGYPVWINSSLFKNVTHGFMGNEPDLATLTKELFFEDETSSVPLLKQVHGIRICSVSEKGEEADGFFLKKGDGFAGIKTADCTPVIIISENHEYASILHCGWKSTLDGIIFEAVEMFKEVGVSAPNLKVLIGPGAQACCYEVGIDLVEKFNNIEEEHKKTSGIKFNSSIKKIDNKYFASVPDLLLTQLQLAGVLPEKVSNLNLCTICDKRFFSFRREGDLSGRQLSFIQI